jgi:DnaJ-class molecular chaperone
MEDYYQILGITDDARKADIKKAFRKLAFKFHPDHNPDNQEQSEIQFKQIKEAYDMLIDDNKRWQYDNLRAILQHREQFIYYSNGNTANINSFHEETLEKVIQELYTMGIGSPRKCQRGFGKRCRWRDNL